MQIICGIGHALAVYQYITEARMFPYESLKNKVHPGHYFDVFGSWVEIIFKLLVIRSFWVYKTRFLDILQLLGQEAKNLSSTTFTNPVLVVSYYHANYNYR